GFGGIDTGFEHGGGTHGQVETDPHDFMHGIIGGGDANGFPGLMSHPDSAGLDPIFWLHHANIHRLWEVWRKNPGTNVDPTEERWLKGPAFTGERPFEMPMPDGTTWAYTPEGVASLAKLDYTYDDVSAPGAPNAFAARINRLRATGLAAPTSPMPKPTELLGASHKSVALAGDDVRTSIKMDKQ